ncbi:MAG: hypothetical protein HKN08_02335 [Gammaproteobacteria bacterium]|nr:hypothetical protein [Gammaproteobacteria bacterium]
MAMLFASAGVLEHAGIKIPYFAFFAHDQGIKAKEPPVNMLLAMAIAAVLCVAIGSYPAILYNILPYDAPYSPYDMTHVLTQLQLLAFAILGVVFLHRSGRYPDEIPSVNLDAEWFYRRMFPAIFGGIKVVVSVLGEMGAQAVRFTLGFFLDKLSRHHGPSGILARTWPTGSMVLWVMVLLFLYMILYYVE